MSDHNVIIVGSGPAGYTAALYAARADLKPLVIAGSITAGGALVNTTEVENYPGFPQGIMGPDLMENMREQAERFGAFISYDDVTEVRLSPEAGLHRVTTATGEEHRAPTVILAMGAQHRHLGVPGEERLGGRGVSYCGVCDAFFFRDREVMVVGGGDSALEDATFIARFARRVTVVHRRDSFRASAAMVARLQQHENISVLWDSEVREIHGDSKVEEVTLESKGRGLYRQAVDGVFIAVGHDPRSALVREFVAVDESGYVRVASPFTHVVPANSILRTLPGVFACGDLVDSRYRQAITAAGSGCAAALDAQRFLEEHPHLSR